MKTCKKCLLNESIEGVYINEEGVCNHCDQYKEFEPLNKQALLHLFNWAKQKNQKYHALVPISGGKDSTYVLYLAVKKYKLKVLTYTFDNGLMSDLARKNIETSIKAAQVEHVWVRPESKLIEELYHTALTKSGEICGVCGMGIERSTLKISEDYKTPLILLGHSPTETSSFTKENLYDQKRMKAILKDGKNIDDDMINELLIYPNMNFISSFLQTKMGKFGKKVNILYYEDLLSDKEIGEIIKRELNWEDSKESEYTRHFDCLAEPFTNYIREKRFGVARRLPQLSTMIRSGEISREEAIKINKEDQKNPLPANYDLIKERFNLSDQNIKDAGDIPLNVYEQQSL
ncbi:MAG: hypothetical protein B7C24_03670 [Bacteroidetes bacterium 4572_77]|nr:MAG: hypothetical protein B7C24_03670 [Bacteroidetes bacterium 4572_77]